MCTISVEMPNMWEFIDCVQWLCELCQTIRVKNYKQETNDVLQFTFNYCSENSLFVLGMKYLVPQYYSLLWQQLWKTDKTIRYYTFPDLLATTALISKPTMLSEHLSVASSKVAWYLVRRESAWYTLMCFRYIQTDHIYDIVAVDVMNWLQYAALVDPWWHTATYT